MRATLFFLAPFMVGPGMATPGFSAEEITFVADEWCPFNCAKGAERPGLLIEIARAVFEPLGRKVDYSVLSWERAIAEVRAGRKTALLGPYKTDAPDFVFPTKEIVSAATVFFTRSDSEWRYEGPASLEGRSLGIIQGYSYGPELDSYLHATGRNGQFVQKASGDQPLATNVKKLLAGRLDIVVDEFNVVRNYLRSEKMDGKSVRAAGRLPGEAVYIAFSPSLPRSVELAKELDEGLARLRGNGKFEKLLERYDFKTPAEGLE